MANPLVIVLTRAEVVYQTKNSSDLLMLSIHVLHMCAGLRGWDQGGGFKDNKGRGEPNMMQDGKVDLQKGTGGDGDPHLCSQVGHSK
jgi:hypothetical protein